MLCQMIACRAVSNRAVPIRFFMVGFAIHGDVAASLKLQPPGLKSCRSALLATPE